ncbi:MAG: Do family serine endopeptidase [Alphaproteobacteria bacterium]|nr:Do family serine endopeptidase [Alphaproteobacteria bacterium]
MTRLPRMKRVLSALVLMGGLAAFVPAGRAGAIPDAAGTVPSLAPMLTNITSGVVNIAVKGRERVQNPLFQDPFFRRFFNLPNGQNFAERETQATGSGVIVDAAQGYVLTNAHVVENETSITVTTKDNRKLPAKLVGRDGDTDVAVLKIDSGHLTAVPFGDSDRLQVGDFVVAIGNPFGLGQTVTSGIVSALGRSGLGIEGYEDFIQTDASINPGNSGGALVDLKGNLVGINTAILAPGGGNIGIGFAVPINMAQKVLDQLVKYGEVKRGRIGVTIQDLTPDLAQAMNTKRTIGAVIAQVAPDSPAQHAGLKTGDLVIDADGVPVKSGTQLRNVIGLTRIGDEVKLTVDRGGSEKSLAIKVELAQQRPAQQRPNMQQH